ncbi:helix-turn-helix domain-containing protein [Streptomyces sp. NPDC006430]|uniref:helix-turn-helix domain-containing protein n=1 Tax=Streptomyces sp. NPDC006430 TaxID=3154299 RepID=UPI0033B723E6
MRLQAAELFEQMIKPVEVARQLRVSRKSAYQWHQLWRDGGVAALTSRGPSGSRCRLSPYCLASCFHEARCPTGDQVSEKCL